MPRSSFNKHYPTLLEALLAARNAAKVTQAELARRLKKPQSYVSKIERRERRIDLIEFIAISRALKIDPQEFFGQVLKKLPKSYDL